MEGRTEDPGGYSEGAWDCLTNLTFPSGTSDRQLLACAVGRITLPLSIRFLCVQRGREGSVGEVGLVPGRERAQQLSFSSPPLIHLSCFFCSHSPALRDACFLTSCEEV